MITKLENITLYYNLSMFSDIKYLRLELSHVYMVTKKVRKANQIKVQKGKPKIVCRNDYKGVFRVS